MSITGKHLINGNWIGGDSSFQADNPMANSKNDISFFNGTVEQVNDAALAASGCAEEFASMAISKRANFLREIANEIDARGEDLTKIGQSETALPAMRLDGERGRTVGQLRFFADWIEEGSWLKARIDSAMPDRQPLPRPDIRVCNKALGPVGVFGASNFPLAFSAAGGDTASALAAGCPVVVKAHSAHPGTSEIVAQAIDAAIKSCKMPAGVFAMVQGGDRSVGQALVAHPEIKAIGFTGSLGGGRALFDIATSRPEPIPFYGELGSNNPVFIMVNALGKNAKEIATSWAASLTMGVGQFCTNPGVIVAIKGAALDDFKQTAVEILKQATPTAMLTDRIAKAYHQITKSHNNDDRLNCLLAAVDNDNPFCAAPGIYSVSYDIWRDNKDLSEEVFGPAAIIIECENEAEMLEIARNFIGQLTTTVHMVAADTKSVSTIMPHLEKKSGRILINGFPTGVEVCHSMVHGGPYPASTDVRSTSVGSLAIERFVRPISYQNIPDELLPMALKNKNPLGISRLVDGKFNDQAV